MNKDDMSKLENLAKALKRVDKPVLKKEIRNEFKLSVMSRIKNTPQETWPFSLQKVVKYIKALVSRAELPDYKRRTIKERIFSLIDEAPQRSAFWHNLFAYHKKFVSSTLLVAIFFGLFAFVSVENNVVRAETFTYLDSYDGDVEVLRDGLHMNLYEGMKVYENDKIITGEDGYAVVKYFDDSISRLSNESTLAVSKLFKARDGYVDSVVEVSLEEGKVWSKVVNLVGKESSFEVTAGEVSAKARKAAFNVEYVDDQVEVEVFDRSVEVVKEDSVGHVVVGKKAIAVKKQSAIRVESMNEQEKKIAWVQDNLVSDEEYMFEVQGKLVAARMKSLGINDENDADLEESFVDKTRLALTFNDVKKQKMKVDMAEKKFIAAEVMLNNEDSISDDGRQEDIEVAVQDFSDEVEEYYEMVGEVKIKDEKYAEELKDYMDDKILTLKKELSVVPSSSPSYELKREVDELIVFTADNEVEAAEIKLDQSLDKLEEAKKIARESFEQETSGAAASTGSADSFVQFTAVPSESEIGIIGSVVEENNADLSDVIGILESIQETESLEEKKKLLTKAFEYFEMVESLGAGLMDEDVASMKIRLTDVKLKLEAMEEEGEDIVPVGDVDVTGTTQIDVTNQQIKDTSTPGTLDKKTVPSSNDDSSISPDETSSGATSTTTIKSNELNRNGDKILPPGL